MNRRLATGLVGLSTLFVATALPVGTAHGQTYEGIAELWEDCDGVSLAGTGQHILDRDNTGIGAEALRITATDGYGTQILLFEYSNGLGSYAGGAGSFSFAPAPQANPISVVITSLAGNELPEVADAPLVVSCPGLPDAIPTPQTRPEIVTTPPTQPATTTTRPATTTTAPSTTAPTTTVTPTTAPAPTTAAPATTVQPGGGVGPAAAARPVRSSPSYTG